MEDLAIELQKIYDSEINIRISWLWDGGIDLWLGDDVGGFEATEGVKSVADVVPWLQEAIAHFYPRARAICPHCGAPNASLPGMTEVIAFVCLHCGMGVKVAPPKVQ